MSKVEYPLVGTKDDHWPTLLTDRHIGGKTRCTNVDPYVAHRFCINKMYRQIVDYYGNIDEPPLESGIKYPEFSFEYSGTGTQRIFHGIARVDAEPDVYEYKLPGRQPDKSANIVIGTIPHLVSGYAVREVAKGMTDSLDAFKREAWTNNPNYPKVPEIKRQYST